MQGKTINGYTLKHRLGEGGMAEVWYAENEIGKPAAVKVLNENLSRNTQIVERFHNEALVMVKLDHPNIRQVYGYGYLGDRHCIIMEYLDGDDLDALLNRGRHFTDEELRRWWNQTVDALNYTHAMGIVHRDIKPSNIFLDKKGNIKLLDFGIAKVKESMSMTRTGMTMGTLMYMSPEQVKDPKRVDSKSDIYSLAVSFVHLLTGKPIYDSDTSSEFDIQLSIVSKPVDLSALPQAWQGFLTPYLEKDPDKRPPLRHFEEVTDVPPMPTPTVEAKTIVGSVASTVVQPNDVSSSPHSETPPQKNLHSGSDQISLESNDKPKSKKGLWIALGAVAAVAVLLILLLKPKKEEPVSTDPDTEAYEACQTIDDYRDYLKDYGRNALHYNEAKQFVDNYMADSVAQAQQALAEAQAQQQAEAEAQAQADAEKKEDAAYKKCTTIAACESYLKAYPKGKYVEEVKAKKAQLEEKAQQETEKKEDEAYNKCTTIAACESYLKAYPKGRYVDEVKAKKEELEAKAAQASLTGTANGHEWVDLGLPSGTKWATCNIGASKPEDYGNYYAWGETQTKSVYSWESYRYAQGTSWKDHRLTKYCNNSSYGNNGFTDNLTTLQGSDDPATANWGSGWHTPSKTQWDELLANTINQWTTRNGVAGRLFTSKKNGKTLFLPVAGNRYDGNLSGAGSRGYYWSRSLSSDGVDGPADAWYLYFFSDGCNMTRSGRHYGRSVRPVREK